MSEIVYCLLEVLGRYVFDGFTDPPKPSGWYRKYIYIGNRTIEETSANQKILTSLELIKLILLSLIGLFVVSILNGKEKYL